MIRDWLKNPPQFKSLRRFLEWLAVLGQYAVTLWQVLSRTVLFLLQSLSRWLRPPGSNIRKVLRARAYRGSRRREYLVHVPPSYERQERLPLVMVCLLYTSPSPRD